MSETATGHRPGRTPGTDRRRGAVTLREEAHVSHVTLDSPRTFAVDPDAAAAHCRVLCRLPGRHHSAEALQRALAAYAGTVLAVTHDRWFARDFDRFLIFGADGEVYESAEPEWDEERVTGEKDRA